MGTENFKFLRACIYLQLSVFRKPPPRHGLPDLFSNSRGPSVTFHHHPHTPVAPMSFIHSVSITPLVVNLSSPLQTGNAHISTNERHESGAHIVHPKLQTAGIAWDETPGSRG